MQNNKTQFGFTPIEEGQKQRLVSGVFSSVASKYDMMNDAMSLGMHRLWKRAMVDQLALSPGMTLLDVASGTGDIASLCQKRQPSLTILATDINAAMLKAGADKRFNQTGHQPHPAGGPTSLTRPACGLPNFTHPACGETSTLTHPACGGGQGGDISGNDIAEGYISPPANTPKNPHAGLHLAVADGSQLPLPSNTADRISIAFGIRNIPDIEAALREFHRTLKPGGKLVCMEFSKPSLGWLQHVYDRYSFQLIPFLGEKISGDRAAYQYLVESIRLFPAQEQFAALIRSAGFSRVTYTNLSGGIVAVHSGVKI